MDSVKVSLRELTDLPQDAYAATKHLVHLLIDKIYPLILGIRNKLLSHNNLELDTARIRDVFTLCSSQINKCVINLLDVFKLEAQYRTLLQESRLYNVERLSWCMNRLFTIEFYLEKSRDHNQFDDTINVITMYFVNWIDHTFQVLSKLSETVYQTGYQDSKELTDQWKSEMINSVTELHVSIDELLLSAMTLCRYCLSDDQHVVKARCKVVLRETKALLCELVDGDPDCTINASIDTLKLPIKPSNVNVLIDVLKDVLYSLEMNTNTALLALVVHCFSYSKSPIEILREHFNNNLKGNCSCLVKEEDDITENCSFVKEFDLYNERLLQIGNFAVSCSADQNRILTLRSGLASLEALDPHLVPALMVSPDSQHAQLLISSWTREVQEIRDSIYLIVDPTAFAEKSKQMIHQKLLSILKENVYNNADINAIINIGCMVHEFFLVYDKFEPDALMQHENMLVLLSDLGKVQKECKIVSNLLSKKDDIIFNIHMPSKNKEASLDQLLKRLKLLYTIINRIHTLLRPSEHDDHMFEGDDEMNYKNATHTVIKNYETYVQSPRKPTNTSQRSIFARTNLRSSTKHIPLMKLTQRFQSKLNSELSFSAQLDRLLNDEKVSSDIILNKSELSNRISYSNILYKSSPMKNRPSLRKAVLNRQCKLPIPEAKVDINVTYDKASVMDATMSLQITDILDQMNDMSSLYSTTKKLQDKTHQTSNITSVNTEKTNNILRIDVNNENTTISKHIWNIPVNASIIEMPLEESASNVTLPSNVNTLERIHDLDFVESKLNSLKSQFETSL